MALANGILNAAVPASANEHWRAAVIGAGPWRTLAASTTPRCSARLIDVSSFPAGTEVPSFGARTHQQDLGRGMSNCVVGSDRGGTPLGVVTEHGVEGYNHLAHHSDDDDLGLFASDGEALGESFESGIVSACAQSCHVENVTHGHATPIDTAVSLKLSAIEVVGCEADEGGDPRVQW